MNKQQMAKEWIGELVYRFYDEYINAREAKKTAEKNRAMAYRNYQTAALLEMEMTPAFRELLNGNPR